MPLKEEFYKRFKISEQPSSIDNEQEREDIKHEIYQRLQQSIDRQRSNDRKRIIKLWTVRSKAAAILIGVCSFLFIGYSYYTREKDKTEYITVQANKGQVLEVLLPDHSTITLNAATIIRYPAKFINSRDVYLEEGEAYFDVSHDASKPFIVHSGGINTKVLGTAFNIKSYKELPNITVTVTRGKVQVNESSKALNTLRPDEQLTFNRSTHKVSTQKVKSANTVTWTHGDFNLDGVYFKEIMLAIENRFSIKAIYDPKVFNNCENSIRFTKKQSLTDVLQVLKTIQPIHYTIKKDSVFISGKPCY
ncbi:FecR family protein [Pedobacter borealis]|uniref:FecR family protein n=1 Tax=Pedobacter borealis TaxID=475254 RepID=UPI00068E6A3B|nr:FecR family protein [Pedobacter borealis]